MYNFILEIVFMVSLGTIIYLMARALPRVSDEIPESPTRFEEWLNSLPLDKIDESFGNFLEKSLRRVRLIILRLDNVVTGKLNHLKKTNGNGKRNGNGKPSIFTTNGNGHPNSFLSEEVRQEEMSSGEDDSYSKSN